MGTSELAEGGSGWKPYQAYVMALICLLAGVATGYLVRGSSAIATAPTPQTQTETQTSAAPHAPSHDQMRHMADKAAAPLVVALDKDPNNAETLARLGSVYFRTQQFDRAVDYYEKAVKAKPSAEGYVSLSNAYHYAGADERAMGALERALQIDPKSANALYNLGMLQWRVKKDPQAAVALWQRLLKSNPNHPRREEVESMIAKASQHVDMPAEPDKTAK